MRDEESEKTSVKTKRISISLMSSTKDARSLIEFVDQMTKTYLDKCKAAQHLNLYIYRLRMRSGDELGSAYWHEVKFQSTRTFSNIYFRGKQALIDKLVFFRDNEQWYKEHGLPWNFGNRSPWQAWDR